MKILNNINNFKSLKDEIVKSKVKNSYDSQISDYIYLQNKVNSVKKILTHKPDLGELDYTKLNKYFNCNKRIIISKKREEIDDIDWRTITINKKNIKKNKNNNKFNIRNPILQSKLEENKTRFNTEFSDAILYKTFYRTNNSKYDNNKLINIKNNYINLIGKNDLYKLPKQIKNKFEYNLTELQNNSVKRKYEIKKKLNKYDRYAKYFIRGLSLSEAQNIYYQNCKKVEMSLNNDEMKNPKYNINYEFKRSKNKSLTRLQSARNKDKNIKSDFVQNYNRALFKYSLKDLINKENPIKIIL